MVSVAMMGYLSSIRQSISSLLTPSKTPLQTELSVDSLDSPSIDKAQRRQNSVRRGSRMFGFFSNNTVVGQRDGTFVNGGTSKSDRQYHGTLPTPTSMGPKRKFGVDYQLNNGDIEGSTLVADDEDESISFERMRAKRMRFDTTDISSGSLDEDSDIDMELDGDTALDGDADSPLTSDSGSSSDDLESSEDEMMLDSADEYDPSGSEVDDMELPKLDRDFANFERELRGYQYSASDMPKHSAKGHGQPPKRSSRNPYDSEDEYRPSPKIVDKNLAKGIVVRDTEDSDMSDESDEEELQETRHRVKKNDRKEVAFDFSMERAKRWANAVKLPSGHWGEAEQDLFFRLAMRGFEPLVPSNWKLDFNTLPDSLFSAPGTPAAYITSIRGHEFRAIKFLSELFSLGNKVRDRQLSRLRPEPILRRILQSYIRWALWDAGLHNRPNAIPIYTVYSLRKHQSTRAAVQILNRRLVTLANRYREAWKLTPSIESDENQTIKANTNILVQYAQRTFPVLTGFLICGPIVAVVTLDSDPIAYPVLDANSSGRFISQFDFAEFGQDVWNALAVAITVVRMRKSMLQLETEGRDEPMWEVGSELQVGLTDEDF